MDSYWILTFCQDQKAGWAPNYGVGQNVHFPNHEVSLCTVVKLVEPNFCVEFDSDKKIWVANEHAQVENLQKRLPEYPMLKDVKEECKCKL